MTDASQEDKDKQKAIFLIPLLRTSINDITPPFIFQWILKKTMCH